MHGKFPCSNLIEIIEGSKWSHSGMIVRSKDIGLTGSNIPEMLFWESNDLTNLPDLILNKTKTGPMIVDLNKRLTTNLATGSDVEFALVQLHVERTQKMFDAIKNYIPVVHDAVFPSMIDMGIEMATGRYYHRFSGMGKIYCAELVAGQLIQMGLLTDHYPMNAYEPKDFSHKGTIGLLDRAWLQPEIQFELA